MKIATMAKGGIGGYLAVKLSIAGFKVSTIAIGAHLAAIKENGLILDGPDGYEKANSWLATENPSDIGAADVIIFGVKCGALEVDWISGAVTRLAKAKGLEALTNETIHGLLSPYKDGL